LGLDPNYWGSAEHIYRRATFRIAHRIAVAVSSVEQVVFSDIPHDMNSVENDYETHYVIIQRDDTDVKVVQGAMRYEYRSDGPGKGWMVPVGDAWSPSML